MDTKMIEVLIKQLEQSSLHEPENTAATPVTPVPDKPQADEGTAVKAPLVGIVYLAPKPGADPYFQVGDHAKKGDVVCIIESMKMMNEIKSTVSGTVKAVKVDNESLVEYDQPLLIVQEDKA